MFCSAELDCHLKKTFVGMSTVKRKVWNNLLPLLPTLVLCLLPAHLLAGTLYTNVSGDFPSNIFRGSVFVTNGDGLSGTAFVATASGNLASIATLLAQSKALPLSIGLYADSSGKPGQLLETWSVSVPTSNQSSVPPLTTLVSVQQPLLSAGTKYWFVVNQGRTANTTYWWPNDQGVRGGLWLTAGSTLNLLSQAFTTLPTPGILLNTQSAVRSGVMAHIAAGGGWSTAINLVNTSSTAVSVTIAFHNDDGTAWSLPATFTQEGATQRTADSSVNTTINPKSTLIITTGDGIPSTSTGWADVISTESLGGFAIFRSAPESGLPSEGTVPLQTQLPYTLTFPYDNTSGFVMGLALANTSVSQANITATIWDETGNRLGAEILSIAGSGHTSFVLPTQIPLTAGKRGIVQFQNWSGGGLAGVGLRFSPFGTFTSVPTI